MHFLLFFPQIFALKCHISLSPTGRDATLRVVRERGRDRLKEEMERKEREMERAEKKVCERERARDRQQNTVCQ